MTYSATGERYALSNSVDVDDSSVLGSHRCRLYDMHSLLTDPRWLGTSVLHMELVSSDRASMALFCSRLRTALEGIVAMRISVLNHHQLRLTHIDIRSVQVDAGKLLPLAEYILFVEVEKPANWRATAPALSSEDPSSVAAVAPAAAVSPFHPASLTGPLHGSGAALCCSLLHGRGDFLAALSTEIAACVRAQKHLQKVLKKHTAAQGGKELYKDEAEEKKQQKELADAEASEAKIAQQEAAEAAAASSSASSSTAPAAAAAAAAAVSVPKSSPSLSARVRVHLQRHEAHRQRLVQLLQTDLGSISLMHVCNVCARILRIEGDKQANGAQPTPAAKAASAAAALQQSSTGQRHVSEQEIAMLRELSLHALGSDASAALAAASALAASSASSALGFAAASAARPAVAAAAAAVAGVASSSSSASSASASALASAAATATAPLLTPAQARARLAELQAKLRLASGADAKARRKKISKKIAELRLKYAEALQEQPDSEQLADGF